jgi:hypothetical protein
VKRTTATSGEDNKQQQATACGDVRECVAKKPGSAPTATASAGVVRVQVAGNVTNSLQYFSPHRSYNLTTHRCIEWSPRGFGASTGRHNQLATSFCGADEIKVLDLIYHTGMEGEAAAA